jgi:phage terminase Nu1 subunit (DNA packaging protein)
MGLPEDQIPGLDVSRERKEHYLAEIARLDALAKRRELVPGDVVTKEASRLGRQIRDLLLIIPGRNAANLATIQDAEAIKTLLEAEIHTALRGLAND